MEHALGRPLYRFGADRSRESATGRPVPQHREASTAGGHMAAQDARSDGADASLALKNEGNAALARGRYAEAISCYSRALEADPSSPVLYSNRAMAHIKAESYGLAIADAEASIRLDASYIKAYYRRGSASTSSRCATSGRSASCGRTTATPGSS